MSKYIDEIITDIKENHSDWSDYKGVGIQKENIRISGYSANTPSFLTLVDIFINGHDMPISIWDCTRLDKAVKHWYKNAPLSTILKPSHP